MSDIVKRMRVAALMAHKKNEGNGSGVWSESAACNNMGANEIEKLRSVAKRLSDALLTLRPLGGSEMFVRFGEDFYVDPDYCKTIISELRAEVHEARKARTDQ